VAAVERGETPPGADPKTHRAIRPYDGLVPAGADWRQSFGDNLHCKW